MSYDFEGEPGTLVPVQKTFRERVEGRYWSFIIWCALDAPLTFINQWGLARLTGKKK